MSRCKEFYDKWEREPNWCEKCPEAVRQINNYIDLIKELGIESTATDSEFLEKPQLEGTPKKPTNVVLSEGAARPLFKEKDPIIRAKAIETVKDCLETKKLPSGQFFKKLNTNDIESIIKKVKREEANKIKIDLPEFSDRYQIIHDEFQNAEIEPNSVDLILTDPPYPEEFLPLWEDLGKFAANFLKPSGFLIAYSGQFHLPEVMSFLSKKLIYYWVMSLELIGQNQLVHSRNVFCRWKPILIFQKEPFKIIGKPFPDILNGSGREKESHDWQQGELELKLLIESFSKEGDLILDPFAGSGTTLIASLKNNRRGIAIEKEGFDIETIKRRVAECIEIEKN